MDKIGWVSKNIRKKMGGRCNFLNLKKMCHMFLEFFPDPPPPLITINVFEIFNDFSLFEAYFH